MKHIGISTGSSLAPNIQSDLHLKQENTTNFELLMYLHHSNTDKKPYQQMQQTSTTADTLILIIKKYFWEKISSIIFKVTTVHTLITKRYQSHCYRRPVE
jgi:hypothetical protein